VLVTNLANRVQPFIRYDLGDRIEMAVDPCPCGSPFPVVRVEGRAGEALAFQTADGREATVLPLALVTVVEETAGVRRFQAIRTGPSSLTVRLETWPDADPDAVRASVRERLAGFLATQGCDAVDVQFAEELPRPDRSGKFRQVWSA
jgi:phenylacetate-coenzyme A ligase PaaK-like adenylate-forming protein